MHPMARSSRSSWRSSASAGRCLAEAERGSLTGRPPDSRRARHEALRHREARRHRSASTICKALDFSRSGFYAWWNRAVSQQASDRKTFGTQARAGHINSDRTYGARRCGKILARRRGGLHRVERLMCALWLPARQHRQVLVKDQGECSVIAETCCIANLRQGRRIKNGWQTYLNLGRKAWLHAVAVVDLFWRRVGRCR